MPMSDTNAELTFKEMCAKFEVTPRTLRYYEYIELIQPKRIGRSRFYSNREVAQLTLILRGKRFGFSLEHIRQWLLLYDRDNNAEQLEKFIEIAGQQLETLEQQRRELDENIGELTHYRQEAADLLAATKGAEKS